MDHPKENLAKVSAATQPSLTISFGGDSVHNALHVVREFNWMLMFSMFMLSSSLAEQQSVRDRVVLMNEYVEGSMAPAFTEP